MFHPLKGEPLTVLVMPKFIVTEHMFDVNDLLQELGAYRYVLYHISWMRWHVIFSSAHQKSRHTSIYVYRLIMWVLFRGGKLPPVAFSA